MTITTDPIAPRRAGARTRRRRRRHRPLAPYLLLAPATAVLIGILAYPLGMLVAISFQRYGLTELIRHRGDWIGLDNYERTLTDATFWAVVVRTVAFTAANVMATMGAGIGIARLMCVVSRPVRLAMTVVLVFVWAMPVVVGVAIWQWMVDFEFGVFNWVLTRLGVGDFANYNWFENPVQGLGVVTAVVVWGAIPFVAITIHAALTQVPDELVEAATIDGANARQIFRYVTFPVIRPVVTLVVVLEIIWDFQVFNQLWLMVGGRPPTSYQLISVYAYTESFGISNYGRGASIAVLMIVMLAGITVLYVRRLMRGEDVAR